METLLNLLLPPKCFLCKYKKVKRPRRGRYICKHCQKHLQLLKSTNCIVCDKPSLTGKTHKVCLSKHSPIATLSIYDYKGLVRHCIKDSKYQRQSFAQLRQLTQLGGKELLDSGYIPPNAIMIPIPLNQAKLKERGFNQAELIATELKQIFKLKVDSKCLLRTEKTVPQYTVTRWHRFQNMKGAFKAKNVKNKSYLLVDDILTTGATLLEASKTLYEAGAKKVYCITLSKSQLDDKINS